MSLHPGNSVNKYNPRRGIVKQHQSVCTAVRFALAASLTASFVIPATARAAQASQNPANLGKVEVTGTRIKRTAIEKAQPVLHISRQQILQSGVVSVGRLLRRISSAGSSANRGYSNGGTGATHIDLRYLGAQRVLVLINGHRLTLGGNASGTGIGLQLGLSQRVDLNTIPTSVIDHIDVLKDGASAVYGTDAIAGVVNIITRKNFNGAEASAYVGGYENHGFDGLAQQYSATLGHTWDRGNVTVNLSYKQAGAISTKDRKISKSIPGTGNKFFNTGHKGDFELNDSSPLGRQFYVLKDSGGTINPTINDLKRFAPSDLNRDNYYYPDLETPQNRIGAYFQGYYALTDHIHFNSTLIYSDRASHSGGGQASVSIAPASNPRPGQAPVVLAADSPYNPFGADIIASNGPSNEVTNLRASAPNAPVGSIKEDSRLLQYIGGFSGDFSVADRNFNWDVSFIYGNDAENSTSMSYNTEHLRRALGSPSQCGPNTYHANCVPYNLFGPNMQAANDYIFTNTLFQDSNSERIYNANISSADVVDLPYGPLGVALGYQHREQDGRVTPDSLKLAGLASGNRVGPTSGSFEVNAVYGEINVPILADLPGAKDLSIDVQTRHSNYSTFGGNTSTRAGFRYQPIGDLLIRGTWSQGFRAPGINDLFGGQADNFPRVQDPCNNVNYPSQSKVVQQRCMAAGVPAGGYKQTASSIRTENGGNHNLQPETAISRTMGLVYSPSALPGLSLDADYYKIEVDHALLTLPSTTLFDACYLGGNQSFCSAITRNPSSGVVNQVLDFKRNIASFSTNGIDYGVSYKFPSTAFGDFTAQVHGTHVILFNETTPNFGGNGGFSTQKFVNTNQGGLASFPNGLPANKINFDLTWNYGNWSANYYLQYISGTTEPCRKGNPLTGLTYNAAGLCSIPAISSADAKNRLRDTVYHDVQVSYSYQPINTTFTVGVNNLLDRSPPVAYSGLADHYNPLVYRLPGRFLYGRITTRF
jgi:outer membrane receptor protein involved in Fe transport